MTKIQLIDVCETVVRGTNHAIAVVGKTLRGETKIVRLIDVPHELYLAVGRDFRDEDKLMYDLNRHLLWRNERRQCRRTECATCDENCDFEGKISRQPCKRVFGTDFRAVSKYEIVMKKGFEGYESELRPFLKIVFVSSGYVAWAAKWLKNQWVGIEIQEVRKGAYDVIEDGVESFMKLKRAAGFEWYEYPDDDDASISFDRFKKCSEQDEKDAPLTVLTFDIETIAEKYDDPKSKRAEYPVGAIGAQWKRSGGGGGGGRETNEDRKIMFVLKGDTTSEVDWPNEKDAADETRIFQDELEMLKSFHDFFLKIDPDVVIGYNSNKFDVPYLVNRSRRLGFDFRDGLTRVPGEEMKLGISKTSTNQSGARTKGLVDCPGRIFLDLYPLVVKDFNLSKLDNHKLDTVAKELGVSKSKGDLPYHRLYEHFHGSKEKRGVLVDYCMTDVEVTSGVEQKMDALGNLKAMCRIERLRPSDSMNRGLGFQLNQLVRYYVVDDDIVCMTPEKDKKMDVLPPFKLVEGYAELFERVKTEKYEGGYVAEPDVGLHRRPVATFDCKSLYPTVVRTKNVCRSTQLIGKNSLPKERVNVSPAGFCFVNDVEGVFPRIMRLMMEKRDETKVEMKKEKNPIRKMALNALQNAYKIVANSLYGQMGASTSPLYMISGAISVTTWGVQHIKRVASTLVSNPEFSKWDLKRVYGDTDSIFVRLGSLEKLSDAEEPVRRMTEWMNRESGLMTGVMEIQHENTAYVLLIKKKKYVKVYPKKDVNKLEVSLHGIDKRNSCPYNRACVKKLFDFAMVQNVSPFEMETEIRSMIQKIHSGEVPRKEFILTTNLSKEVHEYAGEAIKQVVAAKQMMAAGLHVEAGMRIPYYMCRVANGSKKKSGYVVAEELADDYELLYEEYASALVDQLMELRMWEFLNGKTDVEKIQRLKRICDPTTFDRVFRDGLERRRPETTKNDGAMDRFVEKTSRIKRSCADGTGGGGGSKRKSRRVIKGEEHVRTIEEMLFPKQK